MIIIIYVSKFSKSCNNFSKTFYYFISSISSSAASKLTGYTLQHVYGLICASLKEIENDENCLDISNDNKSLGNDGCELVM